ncbi:MAG: HAMP domain-containing histidine kinase [Flavobacteriia bacterium]|nr:HAMP domain-containing histidine kinase [Flavobacteriia bacterium]OIP45703.1 MAG: two-component sensor histidine kinase [Flavobacteriaceae bacterium CG2_30_31_66]PIV97138.1 MAG: two-component sensor histidine kinase [Flavobacteriaceae bacterium CG17_big_fil_post_rev_8_21_14_2_50_31_13]PIX11234.1 MAG: two-component sensor histidine kinase [Flavobacteriaceae bacterium CG_4_8_14_3_um_filter_31_8]PIY14857.1 MAG: two-component sensor histidine kinase [Flavobacteriaceae bacterium CG_4_10_14_3_um_f
MNTKKYQLIFYFITATIVATIAVQFFWNYKNYEENKVRVANEIQLSLDNAIEEYYAKLAKTDYTTILNLSNNPNDTTFPKLPKFDTLFKNSVAFKKFNNSRKKDAEKVKTSFEVTSISFESEDGSFEKEKDTIIKYLKELNQPKLNISPKNIKEIRVQKKDSFQFFSGKKMADSLKLIKSLQPIFISFSTNEIDYKQLDSLLKNQLVLKKIPIDFTFNHYKQDTIFYSTKDSILQTTFEKSVYSKSTFLKDNEDFELRYNNIDFEALKRSSTGIFLSLVLSLLIISCLFYLLKIINQQKELATIKNDLISNITHEFKTPIATISTAIEAIENFNVLDDKVKTKKYLSMSSVQLEKLHQMVEKLLETATLDSEQLYLKKESVDAVELIKKIVAKHQLLCASKTIIFQSNSETILMNVDVFHFENVISNLIDNAIKYGGNSIEIQLNTYKKGTEISISDNGEGIEKTHQEKIFEQFYRVPKGNTHDVKGFGIGLYYCKKIIEKHGGTIVVNSSKNHTIFKIQLPND